MSGNIFVDTNILVYSRDLSEPTKQAVAMDKLEELWQDIEALFAWEPLAVDKKVLIKAKACQTRYQSSWWDSLIISAAFFCNCNTILSEDLNNTQKYFDITVENPFL